ncbi:MJ0042-type zinc finger domain-containing protein [Vitreoscilla stercoraria]|uniref:Zinc finger/thioredoxin putative domain-containing protein n=1 Tax=Vitreoscilla stercoraria TaxID=61 RepID=A0ABY4EDS0_VITST|nr:MJ0042-type zinc finger domain-containing protein [Vitreoscilla stercoraria]UOO93441.1 hypothetical protein LVJ81_05270 [Vitreoscilla stercoraria]
MTNPSEVMYHAQCPNCATVRKISLLQLQENKGLVACRRCDKSYPARGHLLSLEQLDQLMSQASNKSSISSTPPAEEHTQTKITPTSMPISSNPSNTASPPQNAEPAPVVMEHVFVGVIDDVEPVKPAKSMGLLAKLLSRKNTKQNPDISIHTDEMVIDNGNSNTGADGFSASKANLHADDAKPLETAPSQQPSSSDIASETVDDFDIENLDLSHVNALESSAPKKSYTTDSQKNTADKITHHTNDQQNDDYITPILPNSSKIDELLVREASERPNYTLKETEVMAPEYDANRQWFTEMFQTMQQMQNTQLEPVNTETKPENDAAAQDMIQTAKRMNDSGNSNTVTMRLPENSMLVFTLEDNGTTQSMLELPRAEPQAHNQTSVIHTVEVTNQQNEHTMWTVANIVAILVLIIQMFYYFLLLTP